MRVRRIHQTQCRKYLLIGYQGDESLYSKFSYKRMTYDLYAGVTNYRKFHGGSSQSGTFRITDAQGSLTTITHRATRHATATSPDRWPVTFRATYQDDKVTFITHAAYTRYLMPVNISRGESSIRNRRRLSRENGIRQKR